MKRTKHKPISWLLASSLLIGSAALNAQTTIEVGGPGVIGNTVLAPGSAIPAAIGANWSTAGNEAGGTQFIETHLVSPPVAVTATGNVTLTFNHRYFIEQNWDGGGIFVSVDGLPATYVPNTALTGQVYDGTATLGTAWAGGEQVFTGTSPGYATPAFVQTVADLGVLNAGQTVSVEFRHGADEGFSEAGLDWEINTVKITDAAAVDILDADFPADGPSGFTLASAGGGNLTNPWTYPPAVHRFEINADALTSDTYSPNGAETVIDLNGANIEVALLAGTFDIGDTFTLFDTTGSVTLTGSVGSLSLPAGAQWGTSSLATNGTITVLGTANPLINESFDDLDPTLAGNTPGLGLTGTWSGQSLVAAGSLTYGKLGHQGGRAVTNPANAVDSCGVSPGTTLTDAGLLADGATLWFSVLIKKYPDTSPATNDRKTYFSLGTGAPDGFDRIGGDTGSGFTVVINENAAGLDRIQGWNNNSAGTGGAFRSPLVSYAPEGETILAVGKITWGAFNADPLLAVNDVFELYVPDKDLNLGSPVSTLNGNFDQLGTANAANAFDTIGFAGNRWENNVPEVDEIRFAADVADVLPLDFVAPVLVTTDNASGSGVQRVATFDEEIYVGTGDIRIVNETTPGTTTITLPDPQVVLTDRTLTITPTGGLSPGDTYHIEIDAGALTDRNLNAFAGISDPDLWQFTVDNTPPTVATFADNTTPKPILINTSGRLIYTVTFSEPIDAGTVEVADFAASAGSVPITVDSVTATGDPAVFEVAVSTLGTAGTLTLEIVSGAVITDLNGNDLNTTTAIPSDNTLTVNDPTPTAASLLTDFQATIASEQHPTFPNEARYFHVSVNPANAGTGSYAATIVGTNNPAPVFVRNYTGPVLSYKFAGGANNIVGTMGVGMSGGDDSLITHTTVDPAYDGFGQQQAKVWDATDPGADLATGGPGTGGTDLPYIAAADKNAGLFRSLGGAIGTVNISGLTSGSVHIYYGSFSAKPSVRVTMRDLDNVAADIVLSNVHVNDDTANRTEYYLAEIDFVTDGFYDVIEYEWLANGVDYTGNGRGLGTVLTGPDELDDYGTWAAIFAPADLSNPNADLDGDGWTNDQERLFGLDPTSGASVNPISVPLDATAGTFSFTRRNPSLTGLFTDIETSTDLMMWTVDPGAILTPGTPDGNGVQTVGVQLSPGLLTAPKLFVRVNQNDGIVFSANFEDDDGGFTLVGSPNDWEYGTPNTNNGAGLILTGGNGGSTKCWATVLGTDGAIGSGGITIASDSILRSPDINLASAANAQLQFAAAIDALGADTLVVVVREVGTNNPLETINPVTLPYSDTDWNNYGPFAIPGAAGKNVYLEFRYVGTDSDYVGFYIDDVTVQQTAP